MLMEVEYSLQNQDELLIWDDNMQLKLADLMDFY
jgi:hypothetical protein